jgi:hypothetical protein
LTDFPTTLGKLAFRQAFELRHPQLEVGYRRIVALLAIVTVAFLGYRRYEERSEKLLRALDERPVPELLEAPDPDGAATAMREGIEVDHQGSHPCSLNILVKGGREIIDARLGPARLEEAAGVASLVWSSYNYNHRSRALVITIGGVMAAKAVYEAAFRASQVCMHLRWEPKLGVRDR